MSKKILVTGGCGFVGRHLISYLLSESSENEIWIVDNLSTGKNPKELMKEIGVMWKAKKAEN